jgi:hypothetical protein
MIIREKINRERERKGGMKIWPIDRDNKDGLVGRDNKDRLVGQKVGKIQIKGERKHRTQKREDVQKITRTPEGG